MYLALKLAHILCAILAIGCNLTYGAWFGLGAREPEHLAFTLRGVKFLDDKISNLAWLGVGVTGPLLAWMAGYPWSERWVWQGLAALILASLLGLFVYSPLLKRQIAALDSGGPGDPLFLALGRRGTQLGLVFIGLDLYALYLMVFKPAGL
jgi:uncharacterized membrane protein